MIIYGFLVKYDFFLSVKELMFLKVKYFQSEIDNLQK
jgi:hypothetical protein